MYLERGEMWSGSLKVRASACVYVFLLAEALSQECETESVYWML